MSVPSSVLVHTTRTPEVCRDCDEDHDLVDPAWRCPDHGHALVYDGSDEWQDHDACPEPGCTNGRWTG